MDESEPLNWYEYLFLQVMVCFMAASFVLMPLVYGLLVGLLVLLWPLWLAVLIVLWPLWVATSIGGTGYANY
jgi:hypothetical protein